MKESTVKKIVKGGITLFAGFGIGIMMKTGVSALTPEDAGKITKLACKIGGGVLASMLSNAAAKEIDRIDKEFTEMIGGITEGMKMISDYPEDEKENEENCEEEPTASFSSRPCPIVNL